MISRLLSLCLLALLARLALTPALGEVVTHAAPDGSAGRQLVIYSTLDSRLAAPLIAAFQARHPDVTVRYEDLLAADIAARRRPDTALVVVETPANPTNQLIDLQAELKRGYLPNAVWLMNRRTAAKVRKFNANPLTNAPDARNGTKLPLAPAWSWRPA